jgi:type I restriction enzyme S subunit
MKSSAKIIPANSIIIGTRVGVGKVSINKIELCTNQDIMSMTNISTDLSNIFLYFFINYYNEFLKSQQRGATIQGITAPVLKDLNTILPPIEIQNKFASIVEKIEIIKEKENQKLKQLEDLHNSLMQKAFKGEIV